MQTDRRQFAAYAMLGLVMLFWSSNAIVGRAIRFEIEPFTLAFGRWVIACLIAAPFAWRAFAADWPLMRTNWKLMLFLGFTGVGIFNALIYTGLKHTTASNAMLMGAATPAVVTLFDRAIFGIRMDPLRLMGIPLTIAGVAVIAFQGDPGAAWRLQFNPGDLMILAGTSFFALYTTCIKARPPISALSFVVATFIVGAICMAPFALWECLSGSCLAANARVGGSLLFLAIFPSLFCFYFYNWAAQRVGSAQAGQTVNLLPLCGALVSSLLLGEKLHGYHIAGMALILAGIALSALLSGRKQAASAV
jgi:drug/metabolite transporter (DMT)-like permease